MENNLIPSQLTAMENNPTHRVVVNAPTGKMDVVGLFSDFASASSFSVSARKWGGPFPCKYLRVQELRGGKWISLT